MLAKLPSPVRSGPPDSTPSGHRARPAWADPSTRRRRPVPFGLLASESNARKRGSDVGRAYCAPPCDRSLAASRANSILRHGPRDVRDVVEVLTLAWSATVRSSGRVDREITQ